MNKDSSLEHLVRVVSEEIHRGLSHGALARGGASCPWCAQACGGHCSAEVNRMVEVGANRVSALAPGRVHRPFHRFTHRSHAPEGGRGV